MLHKLRSDNSISVAGVAHYSFYPFTQEEPQTSTTYQKVKPTVKPIVISQLNKQDDGMISNIEIPSMSFDEMHFDDYDLSSSTGDHVI